MQDAPLTQPDDATLNRLVSLIQPLLRSPWALVSIDTTGATQRLCAHPNFTATSSLIATPLSGTGFHLLHASDENAATLPLLCSLLAAWLQQWPSPHLPALCEHSPQALLLIDIQRERILAANAAAARLLQSTRAELCSLPAKVMLPGLAHCADTTAAQALEVCSGDGQSFQLTAYLVPHPTLSSAVRALFLEDPRALRHWQEQARIHEGHLHLLIDHLPSLVAVLDTDYRYLFGNQLHHLWFKIPSQALVGQALEEVLDEITLARLQAPLQGAQRGESARVEADLPTHQGEKRVEFQVLPWPREGRVCGIYLIAHDISEHRRQDNTHALETTHDALTALPHRHSFMHSLRAAMSRRSRSGRGMALLYLGVDGMRMLNESFGMEYGDQVLQHLARVLHASIRATDFAARIDGDEFAIILEALEQPEADARRIADKIIRQLDQPTRIAGRPSRLRISMGIVIIGAHTHSGVDLLITEGNTAMYHAKNDGRGGIHITRP